MLLSGRLLGIFRLFHGFRDGASSLGLGVPGVFFFGAVLGLRFGFRDSEIGFRILVELR